MDPGRGAVHCCEHERRGTSEVVLKLPQVLRRTRNTVVFPSLLSFTLICPWVLLCFTCLYTQASEGDLKAEVLQIQPTKSGSVKNLWRVSNFLFVYIYACWYLGSTCVTFLCGIYFCVIKREFKEGHWTYTMTPQTCITSFFALKARYAVFLKYCLDKVMHIDRV